MDARGWVPATAGNISIRLGGGRLAITRSGCHKGFLAAEDVMQVDLDGAALTAGERASAETPLHCQLYRMFPDANAVLHGHSVAATALGMDRQGNVLLAGYEVQKVFADQSTHDAALVVPVFANDQDIDRLAAAIEERLRAGTPAGYLIRGHGVYVWGSGIGQAMARLEGLEFLLACELERRKMR